MPDKAGLLQDTQHKLAQELWQPRPRFPERVEALVIGGLHAKAWQY